MRIICGSIKVNPTPVLWLYCVLTPERLLALLTTREVKCHSPGVAEAQSFSFSQSDIDPCVDDVDPPLCAFTLLDGLQQSRHWCAKCKDNVRSNGEWFAFYNTGATVGSAKAGRDIYADHPCTTSVGPVNHVSSIELLLNSPDFCMLLSIQKSVYNDGRRPIKTLYVTPRTTPTFYPCCLPSQSLQGLYLLG